MTQLSLFDNDDANRPQQAAWLEPRLRTLAGQGIYFGTSSWKYEGWLGTIYSADRYATRGKFSQPKFEAECLTEYAATFPVVCGDFAFYQFPSPECWKRLFGQTPGSFLFGFKVPEEITVARWPRHARYGKRAGTDNEAFLSAELFEQLFARRLEPYRAQVATLIFEFGTFAKSMFPSPDDYFARLDAFLGALPGGWRYGIEIRNPEYLGPAYFSLLAGHGVAHVFNAWTRMPELGTQRQFPGALSADFTVVRALLSRGRNYEQAVKQFEPYKLVQEPDHAARHALAGIADDARQQKKSAYLFVNNRLEGHAPTTIEEVVKEMIAGAG
jgi:uncharacterized protein YecE (DUF72 family)